ncbi:hypothetical protein Tco_1347364 [Tanacetum coccineum]
MVKDFSKLEVAHLNLQLKYQHLKENIKNFKSKSSKDVPEFDTFFELGIRDDQIQGHRNTIRKLKAQISQLKANKSDELRTLDYKSLDSLNFQLTETVTTLQEQLEHFKAENEKVKQHYQELFNSIKVTHVKTIKRTTSLQTEIENLKTQLKGKMPCVTNNIKTSKVSVVVKYAIEVESILASLKNHRNIHNHYLNRLGEILETLRNIELLANVRTSCPTESNKRDNGIATTPLTRKKHETFAEPSKTSGTNTTFHVQQPIVQKTNVLIIHSTGVRNATKARRSKSKNNTINAKTLPAKSVPEKTTCNECTVSLNHAKCVANSLKSSKSPPVKKIRRVKQVKQTWKPIGKIFTIVGYCWKPTGRIFPLGAQCPLTRITKPKGLPVKQCKPTGKLIPLGGQCPLVRPTALNNATMLANPHANTIPMESNPIFSNQRDPNWTWDLIFQTLHCLCSNAGRTDRPLVFELRLLKTYDWRSLTAQEFREEVYRDC